VNLFPQKLYILTSNHPFDDGMIRQGFAEFIKKDPKNYALPFYPGQVIKVHGAFAQALIDSSGMGGFEVEDTGKFAPGMAPEVENPKDEKPKEEPKPKDEKPKEKPKAKPKK